MRNERREFIENARARYEKSKLKCELCVEAARFYLQAVKSGNPQLIEATLEMTRRAVKKDWGEDADAVFTDEVVTIEHLDGRMIEVRLE